jgi:uncharacterized delta-60 repeat protein
MRRMAWSGMGACRVVAGSVVATIAMGGGVLAQDPQSSASFQPPRTQPPLSQFLDMGFWTDGRASTDHFGGDRSAMALQPDGAIVMVGGTFTDFVMARFLSDGTLDAGFGTGGMVTTDIQPDVQEESLAVAIAPDGDIVVAGYSGFDATLAVARHLPDGSLDPSFAAAGIVAGSVPGRGYGVAVQPDGSVVVAGGRDVDDGSSDFTDLLVARFRPDGTLDDAFADGGVYVADLDDAPNVLQDVAILPDGRIMAAGSPNTSGDAGLRTDLVRLLPDGSPDPSFGDGGMASLTGDRVGEGMAVQPDGRIVLAGHAQVGDGTVFEVRRLEADGGPDTSFGDGGAATTDLRDRTEEALDVALDADGRIVAVGRAGDINTDFALARYLPDGTLDASFADQGVLYVDFFLLPDIAESVAIQPDGRILAGGFAQQSFDGYGVTRVLP